ncbi:D-alanine--D-alanine ligase [BD1-7 clade bacterium]|uniref:D-alanine--D-alanine ligase n=1 Tax=BD1-7 clade bacterium TaxID=2029982 RepID=A0A5S9P7V4_9GAMM|nr:D-alanine--D-alanine ligase [BD1-7 clade bacterium]CAA0099632.1 D-alanine--D-alanine ligase [BD1-7 clade bacterium]
MNIEIITSKNAKLKETGFGTLLACGDVQASLERMGHSALVTTCETLEDLESVVRRNPGLVVLAAKYMPIDGYEDVWFSEYFEKNHITFSGSNRETLEYDSDKVFAKKCLANLGIRTAKYFTAIPDEYKFEEDLPILFPLFLKPADAANGNGIDDKSFVNNFSEFNAKILSLYNIYKQPVLVEEYLSGKEFTVAVTENSSGEMTISAIEIVPPESLGGLRILGATVKISDTETLQKIGSHDVNSVKEMAAASFQGLGARGFGRIDVKMDDQGICYFMEANLVPGMNLGSSYFPKACEIANAISYDDVIKLMLEECLERVGMVDSIEQQSLVSGLMQ